MLCFQAPGSLVIVYFLVFSSQENVTTWLPYCVSALQQFLLLGLLLFFDLRARWRRSKGFDNSTSQIPKRLPTTLINESELVLEEEQPMNTSSKKIATLIDEKTPLLE